MEDKVESESERGILKGRDFLNPSWTPFVGLCVLVWSRCWWSGVRVAVNVDIDTLMSVQRLKASVDKDRRVGGSRDIIYPLQSPEQSRAVDIKSEFRECV
jgi:hypothetical protein